MHIPRVGQEVIFSFIGGDIDRPLCTGRVFNQDNLPPWRLPQQQALSGTRSRELKPGGGNSAAGRSNHLLLDDTDQKIQTQLKSDHQHSSLRLGHITRIEDNAGRKDHRGEGFELRTDGHGTVRAKDGLLISTEARAQASGHITDLRSQENSQGERQFPELQAPHILMVSPAGIESTTAQSTHQHSGQHHAITSDGHTSVSTGKSLLGSANEAIRMFSYKLGVKLVSAACDVEFKALDASINLLAKLKITATAQSIHIEAKEEVVINDGGSYSTFKASGMEEATSGTWVAHTTSHSMVGGKSMAVVMPKLPFLALEGKYQTRFDAGALLQVGSIAQSVPYAIFSKQTPDRLAQSQLNPLATALQAQHAKPEQATLVGGQGQWQVFAEHSESPSQGVS